MNKPKEIIRKRFLRSFVYALVLLTFCGCTPKKSELEQARIYAQASQLDYQKAVDMYKSLLAAGSNSETIGFELGELYYRQGKFLEAAGEFKRLPTAAAKKWLAISYYMMGSYTDALGILNQQELNSDAQYLYYRGLTCEKLNLFDSALESYKKIAGLSLPALEAYSSLAGERIRQIEKQVEGLHIKDVSPEINTILVSAPSSEKYPQAGALILLADESIEVSAENTQVSYEHYLIKILNERGKDAFSEAHIEYDSTYEKLQVEYARTIKPDGTLVDVGSRHMRDVSKYLNFPLYSNARIFIISFPEIAEGSIIEYKVKISRNRLVNKKDFAFPYPLQTSEPVIQAKFSITIPKNTELHIKKINEKYNDFGASLEPVISEEKGALVYSWQFKDIPQVIPESDMPAASEINPSFLVSTFESWKEIYDWWWQLARDKIQADAAIKNKVKELLSHAVSAEEKIRALCSFAATKIRYVAVEYGQAGYEPHKAADIFQNKYGDCKDKAVLLVTMLREVGIEAYPVLIATKDSYNASEDFPSILFNHAIAAVVWEGKLVFVDPTAETCAFGDLPQDDQSRIVLVCKDEGFEVLVTPLYQAVHNQLRQDLSLAIQSDDRITGEKIISAAGVYNQMQRYWVLYTPPELIRQHLEEKIQEISVGARLGKYAIQNTDDFNKPLVLEYAFSGSEYATIAGALRILPQLAYLDLSLVAQDSRRYALDFGFLNNKETLMEIQLPADFNVKFLPDNIFEDNSWFRFSVGYAYKNKRISFKQSIELKKTLIPQEQYADFKKIYELLAQKIKQKVVVERKK
ncbi:MAG: DUF3857 domain-containing protein [Candidatus Omnitrophota bacterium]|jgi:hypothetical protein